MNNKRNCEIKNGSIQFLRKHKNYSPRTKINKSLGRPECDMQYRVSKGWFFLLLFINTFVLSSFDGVAPINGATKNGEKFIVVLIPSYNNRIWCRMNLGRLFDQNYDNYHVLYIDDCSDDGMSELVQKYIKDRKQEHRVTYIRNEQRTCALHNQYYGAHLCCDTAIIVNYDGDDWFKTNDALQTINKAYDNPNVWMTWGQFEVFPSNDLGQSRPFPDWVVQSRSYRAYPKWVTSHVRTYYAGLCKKVKLEDCLDENGNFFTMSGDFALMFPMLEMANGRFACIETPIYIYNLYNPLNDCRTNVRKQEHVGELIRNKNHYDPLSMQEAQQSFLKHFNYQFIAQ